jgi:predicted transcriptional regulator
MREREMNRDRHDIVIEILKAAKTGKSQSQIIGEVGLSSALADQYLRNLAEAGLIERDAYKGKLVVTTKRGIGFLQKCMFCPLLNWTK